MVLDRVKVVCMEDEQAAWTEEGELSLFGNGPDALLVLNKATTVMDFISLKARSLGAALSEDPENAIKAGLTSVGLSIGKAFLGAITGKNYHYITHNNPYAKDFSRQVRFQEIQKNRVVRLWTQCLDTLTHAKQDRRMVELSTAGRIKFQILCFSEKDATKLMDAILAAWNIDMQKTEG